MTLDDRITAISTMSVSEKRAEWRRVFGTPAPPAFGGSLLARAIAYRLQEQKTESLTIAERKRIGQIGRTKQQAGSRDTVTSAVKPGTWLSRTWHGDVHQVIVFENDYEYRGERYASLTAIAQHITGAKWSGPRFFGLQSPRLGKLAVTAHG